MGLVPPDAKGRISAIWVQGIVPCGFIAVSCYLHTVEGATGRNVQLLAKAFEGIKGSRCPWILGLDAQQEPRDFLAWAAPMVEMAGGWSRPQWSPHLCPGRSRPR